MKKVCVLLFCFIFPFSGLAEGSPFDPASVQYKLKVQVAIPASVTKDEDLFLWIPYPPENSHQKILRTTIDSPYPWRLGKEKKYGNTILFIKGKVNSKQWFVAMEIDVERLIDTGVSPDKINGESALDPKIYLGPTPWVPSSDEIVRIAREETKNVETPFQKIRALYDYIYETMTYSKEGEGWGKGDPIWACANKRGNCTDFHSLFIALARAQEIPARFEIGVSVPGNKTAGNIPGYHCWAQAFDPIQGWIPLDASESKKKGEKYYYFKKLGQDRILFSVGRDLILNPPQKGEPINYFFSPYAEVDGKKMEKINATYSFQRLL